LPAKASSAYGAQQPSQRRANNPLWTHKLLPALLLVVCCWLAASVVNKGMASAYYFKANYYLELWQRKPDTLTAASWQQAAEAIETAVELHPTHPHYLLIMAKINEWAWYKKIKTADQILVNEQLYKLAIELRPGWPNAYAEYAYFLAMVNFRISEGFDALKLANHYGPFIPETFERTFSIATYHWSLLNSNQKAMGFYALEKMVKYSYKTYHQALQATKDYQLKRDFCVYLKLRKTEFSQKMMLQIQKNFCK
jgi:hypothetical protein